MRRRRSRLFFFLLLLAHELRPLTYIPPRNWLRSVDDKKTPMVIVACGSFSPITYLHLRMFGTFLNPYHVTKILKQSLPFIYASSLIRDGQGPLRGAWRV